MKKMIASHRTRMFQKRILKLNLVIILITFIFVSIFGIINITKINYGSFFSQAFEVAMITQDCNDMREFMEEYPRSTLNRETIRDCEILGLI